MSHPSTPTPHSVRILSIDPGYDRCGLAVLEKVAGKETLLYSSCLTPKRGTLGERLFEIGQTIEKLLAEYAPRAIAMESLFLTNNQKTGMAVAEVRGVARYAAAARGLPVYEYTPIQVKVAVTGYGKSDKKAVMAMVARLVPFPREGAKDDEYDAVAVGLTCLAHERFA